MLEQDGVKSFAATEESADEWVEKIRERWEATLLPQGKISGTCIDYCSATNSLHSWWSGANIPGKKVQPLSWAGGLPSYMKMLDETLKNNYQGWNVDS